jgi:alanine dehydrogenase
LSYHHQPVRVGYGNSIFYLVANMPGWPGVICRVASEMLQVARLPYIKPMLQGLKEAAFRDEGFAKGTSILAGKTSFL